MWSAVLRNARIAYSSVQTVNVQKTKGVPSQKRRRGSQRCVLPVALSATRGKGKMVETATVAREAW